MTDNEHGFTLTSDELAQVVRGAAVELMNEAKDVNDNYRGIIMGAAAAMIMAMRDKGAENIDLVVEIEPDYDPDEGIDA